MWDENEFYQATKNAHRLGDMPEKLKYGADPDRIVDLLRWPGGMDIIEDLMDAVVDIRDASTFRRTPPAFGSSS